MSKSLGNLVFVDALRKEWDPMAIRLGIIEHHYRTRVGVGRRADGARPRARSTAWRRGRRRRRRRPCSTTCGPRLDDDLDTPAAFAAIDAAAARGRRRHAPRPSCSASSSSRTDRLYSPFTRRDLGVRSDVTPVPTMRVVRAGRGAGERSYAVPRAVGPGRPAALVDRHRRFDRLPDRGARRSSAPTTSRSSTRRS